MNEYLQFCLLMSAFAYFWTVMFKRFDWSCSALAGFILIGVAGAALRPSPSHEAFFEAWTTVGFIGLLIARTWLILKEWYHGE